MAKHNDFGKTGEDYVVEYVEKMGYHILERNWRVGHKEIDIICADKDVIVIIEVKTRLREEDYPDELINYRKKKNLLIAGEAYLKTHKLEKELRFDLAIVTGKEYKVQYIQEAIQIFD